MRHCRTAGAILWRPLKPDRQVSGNLTPSPNRAKTTPIATMSQKAWAEQESGIRQPLLDCTDEDEQDLPTMPTPHLNALPEDGGRNEAQPGNLVRFIRSRFT